ELQHLRNKIEIDGYPIGTDNRFDFESYSRVARLEMRRRGRSYRHRRSAAQRDNAASVTSGRDAANRLRDLGRLELSGIAKFTHDLNHRPLPALGRNARRG